MATLKLKNCVLQVISTKSYILSTISIKSPYIGNITFIIQDWLSSFFSVRVVWGEHFHIVKVKFVMKGLLKEIVGKIWLLGKILCKTQFYKIQGCHICSIRQIWKWMITLKTELRPNSW